MCDCMPFCPLAFSVPKIRHLGFSSHNWRPAHQWIRHTTPLRRNYSILGKKGTSSQLRTKLDQHADDLRFKDKGNEHLELNTSLSDLEKADPDSSTQNETVASISTDSSDLDFLESVEGKSKDSSKDEDLVRTEGVVEGAGLNEVGLRRGRQTMRRSNILAKQVISIKSALSLGFVSQLWVDATSWVVLVVEVRPNLLAGESERFLLEDVSQVGDVVLVKDECVIETDFKMVGLETLVGYRVVTPGRRNIGKVRGYTFNINSGAIESLELDSFGISIIPSSLVSTYALLVEDVVEVVSDTVVVHEAAASRIQRLTKGFWDYQGAGTYLDELGEYSGFERPARFDNSGSKRRRSRRGNSPGKMKDKEDEWELPLDYF